MVIAGIIFGFVTSVSITELCACSLSTNDEEPRKSRLSLFRINKNTRTTATDDIQNFASNLSTNILLTVYISLSTGINVSIKCKMFSMLSKFTQPVFTCSKSTLKTPGQCVKSVQSY